jgi:Protein of unknown function (DUF1569).
VDPHLNKLQKEITFAVSGLTTEQLTPHLPGKWCVAEVLEHLYLTYTGTIKGFERLLASGKPTLSASTWKHSAQALLVLGFGYLPEGRQAPPQARPRGLPPETVLTGIAVKIGEMDDVLTQSASSFGASAKVVDHPILGPFSIAQWRKFHLVHGRHHVKQIRRLREIFNV